MSLNPFSTAERLGVRVWIFLHRLDLLKRPRQNRDVKTVPSPFELTVIPVNERGFGFKQGTESQTVQTLHSPKKTKFYNNK